LNATAEAAQTERRRILQALFGRGGDTVWMQPPFYCDYGTNIELGERVFFNFNCVVRRRRLGGRRRDHPAGCHHRGARGDRRGSVVTRDVPAGVFAAGNPCRVIRPIEQGR
jgi:maltose O-acetyltransferase